MVSWVQNEPPSSSTSPLIQSASAPLVTVRQGTLPIILSVPHGGVKRIPGVPRRKTGVTVSDTGTREIAWAVARHIERKTGRKPYLVVAEFDRSYIDVNRAEAQALEDADALLHYRAYHAALRQAVEQTREKWPTSGAILLDLHGQVGFPRSAVRGTRNGKTVTRLTERFGAEAVTGPRSLFGALERDGYACVPRCDAKNQTEAKQYNGGFIVGTYGSHRADGIDAIQIESGNLLRHGKASRERYARALADAILTFYDSYVEPKEKTAP